MRTLRLPADTQGAHIPNFSRLDTILPGELNASRSQELSKLTVIRECRRGALFT